MSKKSKPPDNAVQQNIVAPQQVYDKPKAIYARQSKDKQDSLSIDSQVEMCKRQLEPGEPFEVFIDRGISAKNTDRPQFLKMLEKVKNEEFAGVIVYKLDRFSRNVADFMSIYQIFEKHDVKFISCNESFNTSTPMGRAMLAITAVFAQMERETIVERCRDTYYQRAGMGLYAGGCASYGFRKIPAVKDGIKTYMLEPIPEQIEIVKRVYQYYAEEMMSFSDILKILNSEKPLKPFVRESIKYVLKSGLYVKADSSVYDYLKKSGAFMQSDLSEFNDVNAFHAYGDPKQRKTKKLDTYQNENIVIVMHEGVIESEMWLKSQQRMDGRKTYKRDGKSTHTWLSGLTKCGYCNLALNFSRGGSEKSPSYYATCSGRKNKYCFDRKKKLILSEFETAVKIDMFRYLDALPKVRAKRKSKEKTEIKALRNNLLNLKLREEDVEKIAKEYTRNGVFNLLRTLDNELIEIESERENLQNKIQELERVIEIDDISESELKSYVQRFTDGDLETKKKIAALLIEKVVSTDDKLEIYYRI